MISLERSLIFFPERELWASPSDGGNISHRIEKIRLLCQPETSSLTMDYHGYGWSHGDEDELVPYELGQKLFKEANEPKEFFTIKGAHHNDTYDVGGKKYFQAIHQFIDRYIKSPSIPPL